MQKRMRKTLVAMQLKTIFFGYRDIIIANKTQISLEWKIFRSFKYLFKTILGDSQIVVLDESTSSLGPRMEDRMSAAFDARFCD